VFAPIVQNDFQLQFRILRQKFRQHRNALEEATRDHKAI
jgi:hypothetical protein